MRKLLSLLVLIAFSSWSYGQETTSPATARTAEVAAKKGSRKTRASATSAENRLRINNEVTPRLTLEANLRYGGMNQAIKANDLRAAYFNPNSKADTSAYSGIDYKNRGSYGADVSLNYFFNKDHTFGVGVGVLYMQSIGTFTMNTFRADYKATGVDNKDYRQWITNTIPVSENVQITTVNVPVLLKFKNQFNNKKFGVWADVGPVFGLYNNTKTNGTNAAFNFEAIYKTNGEAGLDNTVAGDPHTSLILTQKQLTLSGKDKDVASLMDNLRKDQGYTVGLDQRPVPSQNSPTNSYNKISFGGMVQAGVSWEIDYRVAFNLGGYFMYQRYVNEGKAQNHLTDPIKGQKTGPFANYYGLGNIINTSDYSSYGVMAGVRIFLGGKGRDTDGDGVPDNQDECRLEKGEPRFKGCPDSDGDDIPNNKDNCAYVSGKLLARGCPDADDDGIADADDSCKTEKGYRIYNGCPSRNAIISALDPTRDTSTTLVAQNGMPMTPHIVLETDVLNFAFGKATLAADAEKILSDAAEGLTKDPNVLIHISGYTDDIGNYKNNLVLSLERAKAARAYLRSKGVAENRIIIAGLGKENPAVANDSPENRAKNRRIEMKLLLPIE